MSLSPLPLYPTLFLPLGSFPVPPVPHLLVTSRLGCGVSAGSPWVPAVMPGARFRQPPTRDSKALMSASPAAHCRGFAGPALESPPGGQPTGAQAPYRPAPLGGRQVAAHTGTRLLQNLTTVGCKQTREGKGGLLHTQKVYSVETERVWEEHGRPQPLSTALSRSNPTPRRGTALEPVSGTSMVEQANLCHQIFCKISANGS